ncbi:hypothetical protein NVP1293O_68 [Vibrio phage 1.293.O._10N.261.52.E1]|nr:hypothetical protein NVP1293O_68 [Vibrio phage 1.293.O._10N.261.52.E1]
MKALFTTLALILSFFSTTSYANPKLLDAATELCNDYYKVARVTVELQEQGVLELELVNEVLNSKMPLKDQEMVIYIINSVYDGVTPVALFDSCYQAAFDLYGSIL